MPPRRRRFDTDSRVFSLTEGSQGHGVAQDIQGLDAVLPVVTHNTVQKVHRPGCDKGGTTFPTVCLSAAKPQDARCKKRHRDDIIVRWSVAMPADSCAGRILCHHDLFESLGRHSADPARDMRKRAKVVRDARIRSWFLARKFVFVAEGAYPSVGEVAAKLEWFQGQCLKSADKALLLSGGEDIRNVPESLGVFRRLEKVRRIVCFITVGISENTAHGRDIRLGSL